MISCAVFLSIDFEFSLENRGKLAEELKRADAVVLTYACDKPATLDHLSNFWLHELRRLEVFNSPIFILLMYISMVLLLLLYIVGVSLIKVKTSL